MTTYLIDRLSNEAARRLAEKVRDGRRRALATISKCCIVTTDDGTKTREHIFDQPPTIGQLADRAWGSLLSDVTTGERRILAALA